MSARRSRKHVPRKHVPVQRITVDEQVADDFIRLLICSLAEGVQAFFDREGDWGPEREVWVRPETYARKLAIPAPEKPKWPWEALVEGLVFLSGKFEIVGDPAAPEYFKVGSGQPKFLRLDNLEVCKQGVKQIYSDLLTRR